MSLMFRRLLGANAGGGGPGGGNGVAVGSFTIDWTTLSATHAVTGLGFTPKLVLLWTAGRSGVTDSLGGVRRTVGAAVSASSRAVAANFSQDSDATASAANAARTDACLARIVMSLGTPSVEALADLQSMDADGFTLVIDDALAATTQHVSYLAIGGASVEVDLREVTLSATGAVAVSGLGFQPTCLIAFGAGGLGAAPTLTSDAEMFVGFASGTGASAQQAWAGNAEHGPTTMVTQGYVNSGALVRLFADPAGGSSVSIGTTATLQSFDSDGYTLDVTALDVARRIFVLAFRGAPVAVGNYAAPSVTSATHAVTGIGFQPAGVLALQTTLGAGVASHDIWSMGAATSASSRTAQSTFDKDNVGTSQVMASVSDSALLTFWSNTSGTDAVADLQTMDADGFTVVMDDGSANSAHVAYLAIGTPA